MKQSQPEAGVQDPAEGTSGLVIVKKGRAHFHFYMLKSCTRNLSHYHPSQKQTGFGKKNLLA